MRDLLFHIIEKVLMWTRISTLLRTDLVFGENVAKNGHCIYTEDGQQGVPMLGRPKKVCAGLNQRPFYLIFTLLWRI